MKFCLHALILLILPHFAFSQTNSAPKLTAGPLVGSVTTTSAKVWISYKGDGPFAVSLQDTVDKTVINSVGQHKIADRWGDTALILDYTGLKAGHSYRVTHTLRSKWTPDCKFTTQIDTPVKDIDFLFGSCALLTTGILRCAFPGADVSIYKRMARTQTNFMVWLGDNVYLLGSDYKNYDNMFRRNLVVRSKFHLMRKFLAAQPNYAIWDDHDYGWNDADRTFPLKEDALKVFRGMWPNTYEDKVKQTYFTFRYNDAEFFMTDGRWWRNPPGDTAGEFLGPEQMSWLKEKLLKSNATFKFICMGSQILNDNHHGESYAHYPVERNQLFDFIATNNIKGVIFLTGDKHYTELSKRDWKGYPMYDFTSSPISSPVLNHKHVKAYNNPWSIKGTVIYRKNWGRIKITGPMDDRSVRLETWGLHGKLRWDYTIKSDELSRK